MANVSNTLCRGVISFVSLLSVWMFLVGFKYQPPRKLGMFKMLCLASVRLFLRGNLVVLYTTSEYI